MQQSKQVIVMRTDLRNSDGHKIRTGKLIAQGAHASLKVILDMMTNGSSEGTTEIKMLGLKNSSALKDWINGRFTKICVGIDSENELLDIYQKAKDAGLICALITDAGLTEFNGVPTKTCIAIGPNWSDEIDKITENLKLL